MTYQQPDEEEHIIFKGEKSQTTMQFVCRDILKVKTEIYGKKDEILLTIFEIYDIVKKYEEVENERRTREREKREREHDENTIANIQ